MSNLLQDRVRLSAERFPNRLAVSAPDARWTFQELDRRSAIMAGALQERGVRPGDRVGILLEKSAAAVASMQGSLRCGSAYVPIDPLGPPERAKKILHDCDARVVVTDARLGAALRSVDHEAPVLDIAEASPTRFEGGDRFPFERPEPGGLAYILYTSGSTGTPKGVCISHINALAFVDWAARELTATPEDVFSNHASFHFDLSVLDLYVPFSVGGRVAIISELASYRPGDLVDFVAKEGVTIWYSVPSALILMMDRDTSGVLSTAGLRCVCFAGEVYPIRQLQDLQRRLPRVRLLNLYGPTETNVCTFYEVRESLAARPTPIPIGIPASGDRVWAEREDGGIAGVGELGELVVDGPTVMLGYWGQPPQMGKPYRTHDLVRLNESGAYEFVGRRDHQVKVRGHRIELGEVEEALKQHELLADVVVTVVGEGLAAKLMACAVARRAQKPSLIALKAFSADRLPRSMIIDGVRFVEALPRTRNGKVDRKAVREIWESTERGLS